ncbi:hypothetical protein ABKV19_006041 [Rosa sericea]
MALRQRKSKRNLSLCNKEIANHPSVSVTTQSNLPNSRSRRCTQRISDNSAIEDASTSISMSAEHSVQDITVFDTSQLRRSKRRRVLQKDTPTVTNSGQASYQRSREVGAEVAQRTEMFCDRHLLCKAKPRKCGDLLHHESTTIGDAHSKKKII